MRIIQLVYEENGMAIRHQFKPGEAQAIVKIIGGEVAYFNPQRYDKTMEFEDKVSLLYRLVLAALISANGAEETLRIMERMGADKLCDITEIKKVFTQVKDALGISKTIDEAVINDEASKKEVESAIAETIRRIR